MIVSALSRFFKNCRLPGFFRKKTSFSDAITADYTADNQMAGSIRQALVYLEKMKGTGSLGDYLGFGLNNQKNLSHIQNLIRELRIEDMRLFGFDSLSSMTGFSRKENKGNPWFFDHQNSFLIKGRYADTLTLQKARKYKIKKASLILIDSQLYSAAKKALNFSLPMIQAHAIIIFDNCNKERFWGNNLGGEKAFREFLKENRRFHATELEMNYNNSNCKMFLVSNLEYQYQLTFVSKQRSVNTNKRILRFSELPISAN